MRYLFFVLSFMLASSAVHAEGGVVINEIAWMGTANSANDEWLELYNSGSNSVDLSGWTLEAADGSPKVALAGSIAPGGYFLLERTDDSVVPNIPADQIYSGALSNSGEVLILKNAQGAEVDRVDGSGNWQGIGGNNDTKETAQRTSSGWTTGAPTPKSHASTGSAQGSSTGSSGDASASSTQDVVSQAVPARSSSSSIKADAGENIIAQVGQQIFFDGSKSLGSGLKFSWNMGNGDMKEGKSFLYGYQFPGKYIVTLFVESGAQQSHSQIEVTIYPSDVLISEFFSGSDKDGGWVEIHNASGNFVDLSGWKLDNGGDVFEVPKGTFLASDGYLMFSESVLGQGFVNKNGELFFLYPNGQAIDKVKYEFKNNDLSASRKNKDEFVFTKSKTPGFENVTVSQETALKNAKNSRVSENAGVPKNLISENYASFVGVNGVKSFLAEPAYAMVSGEEKSSSKSEFNLKADASSIFSGNFFYGMLFAAGLFLLGFLFAKRYFKQQ